MQSKHGKHVSVLKDMNSDNPLTFDSQFLRPKKANTKFLMGGLFFNEQYEKNG
jgi:hypothetical protein